MEIPDFFRQKGALRNRRKSIPTDPKGMHAVLGRITVMVLPKMCQQILENIISANNLYCSFQNRNDLRIILVEEELEIINRMMSNGYKHFTIQLCYKILRHEQWVGKPRQNWGNVPIHTDIHISDDIERIRLSRNKIVSMETKSLDKTTFLTLIDELRDIAKRVDFYLKKDVNNFVLQIEPTESMTKAEIESTVEEIRRLPAIEDNPFPVHTISQGRSNYARLGLVVVDIFQQIFRQIVHKIITPQDLSQRIRKKIENDPVFFDKMTYEGQKSLNTLTDGTYDHINFTTLYSLMRLLRLINMPIQGWGKPPKNANVTISDDVERLRFTRNEIAHLAKVDVHSTDMENYFSKIIHITERIDKYLCQQTHQGFTRKVYESKTDCMDPEMEQKYYQALKDIEDIKKKLSVENVNFYYGKTTSKLIQDVKNKVQNSVIHLSLVLEVINDNEKQRILNELKTEINSGQVDIKFIQAVSGSLIIYIDILDSNLLSTEHELGNQIYHFLCRALQLTRFNMKTENEITVVLIKEEDDIEVEFSIESDNWETYDEEISLRSNSLCLELDVDAEIFNTEQKMQSELCLLVESVLGSNGKSNIESVSARLEPGIVEQNPCSRPPHERDTHKRELDESFRPPHERDAHKRPPHERDSHKRPPHERDSHNILKTILLKTIRDSGVGPPHERDAHERDSGVVLENILSTEDEYDSSEDEYDSSEDGYGASGVDGELDESFPGLDERFLLHHERGDNTGPPHERDAHEILHHERGDNTDGRDVTLKDIGKTESEKPVADWHPVPPATSPPNPPI